MRNSFRDTDAVVWRRLHAARHPKVSALQASHDGCVRSSCLCILPQRARIMKVSCMRNACQRDGAKSWHAPDKIICAARRQTAAMLYSTSSDDKGVVRVSQFHEAPVKYIATLPLQIPPHAPSGDISYLYCA